MGRRRRIVRFLAASGGGSPSAPERFHWDLNGSDEYLYRTAASPMDIANAWAIGLNIRSLSLAAVDQRILNIRPASGLANFILLYWNNSPLGLTALCYDSSGSLFKDLFWSSVLTEGVGAHLIFSFDGTAGGDPLTLAVNGTRVSPDGGTDSTGTMTGTSRRIALGTNPNSLGGDVWGGGLQDAWLASAATSVADEGSLYSQRNDADPLSGFASAEHHWTPQGSGSAAFVDQIGSLDLTSNNVDDADRVQGNLIP